MLSFDKVKKMRPKVASRPLMAIAVAMVFVHMMGSNVVAEDPVQVLDWSVEYMDAYPLGVAQQVTNAHPSQSWSTSTNLQWSRRNGHQNSTSVIRCL